MNIAASDKSSAAPSTGHGGAEQDAGVAAEQSSKPKPTANGDDHLQSTTNGQKPNPKDPSRPRRKKARRACFACQRAHLTCGDERPCQRCIKRGLQDACHDGVRKKAKYLHDAPDGALMPGIGGNNFYNNPLPNGLSRNGTNTIHAATAATTTTASSNNNPQNSGANFYPTPQSSSYNMYQDTPQLNHQNSFTSQSPVSPTFSLKANPTHRNSIASANNNNPNPSSMTPSVPAPSSTTTGAAAAAAAAAVGAVSGAPNQNQNPFAGPFFDPSDPALFNFDLSSMNFENRYGALEFGMLGHMATGAGDSPTDSATQRGSMGRSGSAQFATTPITGAATFGESPGNQPPFMFGDPLLNEWPSGQGPGQTHVNVTGVYPQSSQGNVIPGHLSKADAPPHAFAIESAPPPNFASPNATASPQMNTGFDDLTGFNNAVAATATNTLTGKSNGLAVNGQHHQHQHQQQQQQQHHHHQQPRPPMISTPSLKHQSLQMSKRRQRNPSAIYESVKEPYAYTSRFHNLTAFIQRRFSPQKTLKIAKALASIRPSFIATTKTLNRDDLIFMEKCFQRTLWEYEDFINACGTPTIVCRRTGEIAAVGKEFSILTGWKKEVLLGKEPNLNVNTGNPSVSGASSRSYTPRGGSASAEGTTAGTTATSTSTSTTTTGATGRPHPVFLAELLDDDSVVDFYEDFARLAFGDSRGSVMTTCKLLKYKTKEDMELAQSDDSQRWNNHLRKGGIASEAGMNQLGFKDGKVECAYCWTVKRDVFDIPMLIVMNFLPCI